MSFTCGTSFAITYLGWDSGLPRIELDGVEITHFSRTGNKLIRYVAFSSVC